MMKVFLKRMSVLVVVLSLVVSCSSNDNDGITKSGVEARVVQLAPANNETDVSANVTFKWAGEYVGGGDVTYSLYLGEDATNLVEVAKGLSETEYSYSGITQSTVFYWKVVMVSGDKVVGESDVWSFTTTSPPGNFSLQSPANDSVLAESVVSLKWSASDGAINYEVYVGTDEDDLQKVGETNQLEFNVDLSLYGVKYFWRIVAVNETGGEAKSEVRSFILNRYPTRPVLLAPSYYEHGVSLTTGLIWSSTDPDGDMVTYNLYFGTTTSLVEVARGLREGEFFPGELSPSTMYFWRVEAVDSYGFEITGELWVFVTDSPPSQPLLRSPSNDASGVYIAPVLQWGRSQDTDSDYVTYNVYLGTTTSPVKVGEGLTDNSFDAGSLEVHKKYYWKVEAVDSAGLVSESNLWSFTTDAPPAAPMLDSPSDSAVNVVMNPVKLRWYPSISTQSSTVTYTVYLKKAGEEFSEKATSITGTSYDLYGLEPGTTYYWKIAAVNISGMMSESAVRTFRTDNMPGKPLLDSPANLSSHIGLVPTELRWLPSTATDSTTVSYTIYLKKEGEEFSEKVTSITGNVYYLYRLSPGTTYYWKVAAINLSGMMTESDVWKFETDHSPERPRLFSPVNNSKGFPTDGTFQWHSVTDPEGDPVTYRLCLENQENFSVMCVYNITNNQYSLADKGGYLFAFTSYRWYVIAEDSLGATISSEAWYFTTDHQKGGISYVEAGKYDTYYVDSNGELLAFGKNGEGELADGTTVDRNKPQSIANPDNRKWIMVGAGSLHVCAVDDGGDLYCWGWDKYGQLGIGYETPYARTSLYKVDNPDGNNWIAVDGGDRHTCAIDDAGVLYCWGENSYKQSGQEDTSDILSPKVVAGSSDRFWTDVDVGYFFSCAMDNQDRLWCWGDNTHDQVAATAPTAYPVEITNGDGTGWSSFSAGYDHACAIDLSGSLWCWGSNSNGQLGNGNTGVNVDASSPVKIYNPDDPYLKWKYIRTNGYNTCAIDENDTLWCWGKGYDGDLGDGTLNDSDVPVKVENGDIKTWSRVAIGPEHTCGVDSSNTLWCWGRNEYGQLGLGTTYESYYVVPKLIVNGNNTMWISISTGGYSSFGIDNRNRLYAWGRNNNSQLANYARLGYNDYDFPITVESDSPIVSVSGGYDHACAIDSDKHLWCVGGNGYGQLGDGSNESEKYPVMINNSSGTDWSKIAGGYYFTCGIDTAGNLWCWGRNSNGQLGTGETGTYNNYPLLVTNSDGTRWAYVDLGYFHTCGIDVQGNLWCWGENAYGKLGTGDEVDHTYPVLITNSMGTKWSSVSLGIKQTCGVDVENNLWCWGDNSLGQLGTGDYTGSYYPVIVSNSAGTSWSSVSLDQFSTCGIDTESTLWCWGVNDSGQLGNGTTNSSNVPVVVTNSAGSLWSEVDVGAAYACARDVNDNLWCWGENGDYQIGLGESLRIFPARVYGF